MEKWELNLLKTKIKPLDILFNNEISQIIDIYIFLYAQDSANSEIIRNNILERLEILIKTSQKIKNNVSKYFNNQKNTAIELYELVKLEINKYFKKPNLNVR
ncbi:hypothetical protein [Metamycoplasma equirhinis]|uniref:hypothetical protein n=1 Tax=Metamycoplasma equirhinis TaxID=92402 RepID=UPI0035932E57